MSTGQDTPPVDGQSVAKNQKKYGLIIVIALGLIAVAVFPAIYQARKSRDRVTMLSRLGAIQHAYVFYAMTARGIGPASVDNLHSPLLQYDQDPISEEVRKLSGPKVGEDAFQDIRNQRISVVWGADLDRNSGKLLAWETGLTQLRPTVTMNGALKIMSPAEFDVAPKAFGTE